LLEAAKELSIDLSNSFMIGDKLADVQAGHAAGCDTYLVKTGYGKDFQAAVITYGAKIVNDLSEAADMIIAAEK
jgi:D-glycero-D-manno-heptose 1,7-bisphosphate phosphatase